MTANRPPQYKAKKPVSQEPPRKEFISLPAGPLLQVATGGLIKPGDSAEDCLARSRERAAVPLLISCLP